MRARMVPVATITAPLHRAVRDLARTPARGSAGRSGTYTELDRSVLEQARRPAAPPGPQRGRPRHRAAGARRGRQAALGPVRSTPPSSAPRSSSHGRRRPRHRPRPGAGSGPARPATPRRRGRRRGASKPSSAPGCPPRRRSRTCRAGGSASTSSGPTSSPVRGRVEVHYEPGAGSEFRLIVPITLAVLPCLLVEAAGRRFGVPMHSVVSAEAAGWPRTRRGPGRHQGAGTRSCPSPTWPPPSASPPARPRRRPGDSSAVVLASMTRRHAFRVDALLGQRNVVVKDLGRLLPRLALLAGASLEPDGSILLVLDVSGLVDRARWSRSGGAGRAAPAATPAVPAPAGPASVLVVDDTTVVRELERSILEEAGYLVRPPPTAAWRWPRSPTPRSTWSSPTSRCPWTAWS